MKILFVIHGLRSGGAERVLVMLCNQLVTMGFDISILMFSNKSSFYFVDQRINIIMIEHQLNGKTLLDKVKFLFKRIDILRIHFLQVNPDVIVSFITAMNLFSIIAAKLARKKIIVSEHTNYNVDATTIRGFIRRILYPFADAVVVLTNHDKKYYRFIKNIYVVENPLVLTHRHENIKREKIVLGVGTLVYLKGFDLLIKAFSEVSTHDWTLIILGDGPERDNLIKLVSQLNLENRIIFPGTVKDVEYYYKKASIFILSSRIEGFPGVLCEAMGYGCPSIAFDCLTGPRDIITNDVDGILVPAENTADLTKVLSKLMRNSNKRNQLSIHSQAITNRLNIEKITNKWIMLFKKIVS